jgi:hypothetical protein
MLFCTAYLNKAAVQKFLTQHIQFLRCPGAGVCFNYNFPPDSYRDRDQVLAPYTPVGSGCQGFSEPVLSPLLYNSNLLRVKGIFEDAKVRKYGYVSACLRSDLLSGVS